MLQEPSPRSAEQDLGRMMLRSKSFVAAAALLAMCLPLAGCSKPRRTDGVTVEDAWVRLPVVAGRPGAAYFTLRNGGPATTLEGVASAKVGRIELHESMGDGGVMRMSALPTVELPAGATVTFEPSGKHAMLFDVDPAVKPGDRMTLRFSVRPNITIDAEAEVRAATDAGHDVH